MRRAMVWWLLLCLFGAACSASSSSGDAATSSGDPTATRSTEPDRQADEQTGDDSTADDLADGDSTGRDVAGDDPDAPAPFDAVLIELFDTDDVERYRYDLDRRAEALLVACMADAGFEFTVPTPIPPSAGRAELASDEFAASYGFGIVDLFRRWIGGFDDNTWQFDSNERYVASLSGAEAQRYFRVLDGIEPEPGQLPTETGCRGRAGNEAYADWNRFFDALPNYTAMAEERDSHPDWLAARATWRSCMVERGFDYAEPEAIRSDVQRRMTDAVEEAVPDGRLPLVLEGDQWVVDASVAPLLADLERFEIEAAVANLSCAEPVTDVFRSVEFEVQQGFVDRNRAVIDELLATAG